MNADLPRMERVPAEGPTYRQRHSAAVDAARQRAAAGSPPDARVVCAKPDHTGRQPVVAELWSVGGLTSSGNDVLWLTRYPDPAGAPHLKQRLDRLETLGIDWKLRGDLERLKSKGLSVHLINVPPEERVDCTEAEGLGINDEPETAWHTSEWPGGPDVVAYCPEHGFMPPPDRVELLELLSRGRRPNGRPLRILLH